MKEEEAMEKIAKGTFIVFLGLIVSKILGYLFRVIVARIGTEEYGLLSLGLAVVGFVSLIGLFGMNQGAMRYTAYYLGKRDKEGIKGAILGSFKISFVLSLVLSVLFFIFSDKIAVGLFHNESLGLIFKVLAIAIPFDAIRVLFMDAMKGLQKVQYEVYSKNFVENTVKVLLTLLLVAYGMKALGASIAYVVAVIFSCLVSFFFLQFRVFRIIGSRVKEKEIKKSLLDYSWPLLFTGMLTYMIAWIDTFMVAYFKDVSQVGIYNAALPTALLMYILPYALMTITFPVMTMLYSRGEKELFSTTYKSTTKWIFMLNVVLFSFFFLFSKQIMNLIFSSDYLGAGVPLVILSFGYLLSYTSKPSEKVLMVIKKTKLVFFNFLCAAIVNVLLNYFLIPRYNLIGAAIGTSISFIVLGLLTYLETFYFIKGHFFSWDYVKVIFSIILAVSAVWFMNKFLDINVYWMIFMSGVMVLFYFGLLLLMGALDREDLKIIRLIGGKLGVKTDILERFVK